MPSFAVQRFLDATISPEGSVISIRFHTDTDEVVVLDLATAALQEAIVPLIGAIERAHEKAGNADPLAPSARAPATFLPVTLMASAVHQSAASSETVLKVWLSPGRLPLRINLPPLPMQQLLKKLMQLAGSQDVGG